MDQKFKRHPIKLPFNCPLCNIDLDLGLETERRCCIHVQFIRMTGELFDYFVYVHPLFAEQYLAAMKISDQYRHYLEKNGREPVGEQTCVEFVQGNYLSISEIASAVPYFEDVAVAAAWPGSALFIEKRSYGNVVFCIGELPVNTQDT